MAERVTTLSRNGGGRVILLFLLFLVAIYALITAGLPLFAVVCISPFLILAVYAMFSWKMSTFWLLLIVNYFIQFKNLPPLPIPTSVPNELLQILLIAIAILDIRKEPLFGRTLNLMLFSLSVWALFCFIEVLNDTCGLGINFAGWYGLTRMMCFQIIYIFIVFTLYISSPEVLQKYLRFWAILSLFSVFWTWKQIHLGMTASERVWFENAGRTTHFVSGIIRWWSTFNDAANYGCNAAGTALTFFVIAITTKIKWDRIFFGVTGLLVMWGMFQSGTRTAMFCLIAGFMVFLVLSKSVKIIVPSAIIGSILLGLLVFTNIGQGNNQIRRMRSAFNKNDASANVRTINQQTIRKYMQDAPWGIGYGASWDNVPANNKYNKLSKIPPDSEYVFIWVHAGPIGLTVFLISTLIMFLGACHITMFRLKSRSLMGIGAGLCGAFAAIQLGGYANQVLMQFPNCLIFYGGLTIVYLLPYLEPAWIELEEKRFAEQEERKRLKLEKKLASRV